MTQESSPDPGTDLSALLEKAICISATKHSGQREKAGRPYVLHPLRVMMRMTTDAERIVAVLHDVVEDTDVTPSDLRALGFPDYLLDALDCVTKREGEKYDDFVKRSASNPIARQVKIGDLLDNLDVTRLGGVQAKDVDRLNRYLTALAYLRSL